MSLSNLNEELEVQKYLPNFPSLGLSRHGKQKRRAVAEISVKIADRNSEVQANVTKLRINKDWRNFSGRTKFLSICSRNVCIGNYKY